MKTTRHSISAMVAVALLLPCLAHAVSIGNIALQSSLGEPLRAQVDLMLDKGERVDDACISLAPPDPAEADAGSYLTKLDISPLTLKTDGARQYIAINSRRLFNEAFARLRLQVQCPGVGTVVRTLTILPDLDIPVVRAVAVDTKPPAAVVAAPIAPLPEVIQSPIKAAHAAHARTARSHARRSIAPAAKNGAPGRSAHARTTFRLKLSGNPIDESRIGKISAGERAQMLARQKFLDTDDQMASFLMLQQQVRDLQAALGEIKQKLAPLNAAAPTPQPAPAPVQVPVPAKKPPVAAKPGAGSQNELPDELLAALGGALAILVLWLGWRQFTRFKPRRLSDAQLVSVTPLDFSGHATPQPPPPPVDRPPLPAAAPKAGAPAATVTEPQATIMTPAGEPLAEHEEIPEDEMLLEEAGLYVFHGRPARAVEILQHAIKINPAKVEAWSLLLSIYSSLAKAAEFEAAARAFIKHHEGHPSWGNIQALGRTLDGNNPLYAAEEGHANDQPSLKIRRQIGDILMETGVLSKDDLQRYLNEYNQKIHGRFGGYLVTRKAITLAQLDQALLLQQKGDAEKEPGEKTHATPPVEDFMAALNRQQEASAEQPAQTQSASAEPPAKISRKDMPPDTLNFEFPLFSLPETGPADEEPADKKPDTK